MIRCEGAKGYDPDAVSRETSFTCVGASLTQQQFAEECDINVILDRFALTGRMPENLKIPQFVDVTADQMDFHTAMNYVVEAQNAFLQVPADVRARFGHDPAAFFAFCTDPANGAELKRMGLAVEREPITAASQAATPPGKGEPTASGPAST